MFSFVDRLKFFHTTGDPTTRVDTISAWVGQLFMSISVLGCHQCIAQRYLSMKTVKQVQRYKNFITINKIL